MGLPISRREFAKAALAFGALAGAPLTRKACGVAPVAKPASTQTRLRYRAVSWWLTWDDLTWPNAELQDRIRRRADQCVESAVNCCLIFGAHFRWDFMPLWGRLHDELRFIADELHQRGILLFDHHSSVLTHRPRDRAAAVRIWQRNRHHVPFYPSGAEAATWRFGGSHLNDWRMRDVETGAPIYLPAYEAEQFCMNHPAFRAAYAQYVKQLLAESGVDGLMSDDNIFYADWRACACAHCRTRFKRRYDRGLPPVSDATVWGNRQSEVFKDWIAMRFQSAGDFLGVVKAALPKGFPLLTCCASSDGPTLPAYGMSYQDFIQHCNHVLLEMVGSTPSVAGTWDERAPSQLLHLGIAQAHRAPCFGLGYGFYPDTAFFIWAVNKFLGSDSWLSTLKGRLDASSTELAALADDAELVGEGYRWERDHPGLFTGEVDTDVAVFFSRATRDYYGQVAGDYTNDFAASCLGLLRAGLTCEVMTEIPVLGKLRCLILSSVVCLSRERRERLKRFMQAGGLVITTGPTGLLNERANPVATWLGEFGITAACSEPARAGGFPPYQNWKPPVEVAECRVADTLRERMQGGWLRIAIGQGELLWRPERISRLAPTQEVIKVLRARRVADVRISGFPGPWQVRQFRDRECLRIHALPAKVAPVFHATLKNQISGQPVIEKLKFAPLTGELKLETGRPFKQVTLHSPDLSASRAARQVAEHQWSLPGGGIRRYLIVECVG